MLTAFWSGMGGELAKHWATRILTAALVFWTGGAVVVWWSVQHDEVDARGWSAAWRATGDSIGQLPVVAQLLLLFAALLLLAASGMIAERLTLPLLRALEGYWSRPAFVRRRLIDHRREVRSTAVERVGQLRIREARGDLALSELDELRSLGRVDALDGSQQARLQQLSERAARLSAAEAAELSRGVALLRNTPREDHLGMPTRLGDILRAAERRPSDKYGLDAIACWYRLWLVMPQETRSEIVEVRAAIDSALRTCLWSALFLVWTPWLWWIAVPIGVIVPFVVYRFSMLPAAALFGELLDTAFDLHRMQLYDALHLPRPSSAADEHRCGAQLTGLLWHGDTDPSIVYVAPNK